METTNSRPTFPQRNWLLIAILVAIISPLVVHWVGAGARKEAYRESVDTKPAAGATGDVASPAAGAGGAAAGNASPAAPASPAPKDGRDTSYKVATPPTTPPADPKKKN